MQNGHKNHVFRDLGVTKKLNISLLPYYKHVFSRFILQVCLNKQFLETVLLIFITEYSQSSKP